MDAAGGRHRGTAAVPAIQVGGGAGAGSVGSQVINAKDERLPAAGDFSGEYLST